MKVAFFAPMKSPRHSVPSGDRLMARQLMTALAAGSADVQLASELRIYAREPGLQHLREVKDAAAEEAERLIAVWSNTGWRPDIWFSYHPYYKAPDLIGPAIATHFDIPMVTAEASYAERRATGKWAAWHAANLGSLQAARCHFTMTTRDRRGLESMPALAAKLADLPPFLDTADFAGTSRSKVLSGALQSGPIRLATVAMMRADVKRDSYQFLACALATLTDLDWTLEVIGDGAARADIEHAFSDLPSGRITWHGQLERDAIIAILKHANVFVWPGIEEAYGLAFLEAQAMGLAVVALDNAGVPEAVCHERTGVLTPPGDQIAYAEAIRRYSRNRTLLDKHSRQARAFVLKERSLTQACDRIFQTLDQIMLE